MIMTPSHPFTSTLLLSHEAHRRADEFCQQHRDIQKAEQIYLNTLAVYAVHDYLRDTGLTPDFNQGDSWNPIFRNCLNVADLMVPPYGRLECRPIRAGDCTLLAPAETWQDRLAYIAVELDDTLAQATLVGFVNQTVVQSIQTEAIALNHLRPIEALGDYLDQSVAPKQPLALGQWTHLRDWLNDKVDETWQTLDGLLGVQSLALQTRSAPSVPSATTIPRPSLKRSDRPAKRVSRAKLIDLPSKLEPTALVVQIFPIESLELLISVKLCPVGTQTHLSPDLDVQIRDETGEAVIQTQTRRTEMIDIEFSAAAGDRFSLAVRLRDSEYVEHFTV